MSQGMLAAQFKIYMAGIFDGEGYVGAHTTSKRPQDKYNDIRISIGFKNGSDGGVLYKAKKIWKGNVYISKHDVIYWDLKGRACEYFLRDIYPFISIKKAQVKLALDLRATKCIYWRKGKGNRGIPQSIYDKRLKIGNAIKALNHNTGFGRKT